MNKVTLVSLGYPLSVFNKNSTLKILEQKTFKFTLFVILGLVPFPDDYFPGLLR